MYNSQANNPLYKGFTCPYCGDTVRTRQGLSGHIQYKHGITGQKKSKKEVKFEITMNGISDTLLVWKSGLKPSKFEYEAVVDMFIWWTHVKLLVEGFGLELNEQDLHNYIITSLANIRQNTQLLKQLKTTFNWLAHELKVGGLSLKRGVSAFVSIYMLIQVMLAYAQANMYANSGGVSICAS